MSRFKVLFFGAVLVAAAAVSGAQQTPQPPAEGRIVGRVIDAATGQGIPEAGIQVVGTTIGSQSGVDGRFSLSHVPAGTVTIQVRRVGFGAKQVTGLFLNAGQSLQQDVSLAAVVTQIAAQVVSAAAEKGTVSEALDQQRIAVGVVNSVTAEQITKSPDGDAAQALKRISGVTVMDNKFPVMRGLGERYTTSSLNGSRIPSPEPEKRVVPLDMFPAGLVQSITASKTFSPDLQGDFSGALIDIKTKEFPATRTGALVIGSGYAAGATGSRLPSATSVGGESFGVVNHKRDLPPIIANLGNFQNVDLSRQADVNRLVGAFRNSWTPQVAMATPLVNGSASFGGNDPLLFGHRVGYLVSGSISSGTDVKDDQVRALADRGSVPGSTVEMDHFDGKTISHGVLWGGLTNISTMLGDNSRVFFNGLFNRSADNDARVENGEFTGDDIRVRISRMQYVQRGVYSGQLGGEHQAGIHRFDWSATASGVRRYEPDRSEFVQVIDTDPSGLEHFRWLTGGTGGAVRTFGDLHENSHEYKANYAIGLGPASTQATIKVGGLYRATDRDADSRSYSISAHGATNDIRELPPEQLFDGRFTTPEANLFSLAPLLQGGSYTARDRLSAGFAMAEVPIGPRLRVIGGARYESDHLDVDAASTLGSKVLTQKIWNDLLPSLAFNIKLTETQQLRLSGSRTLARPEYRELSPIISRDVIGGENVRGEETLNRTNITNADIRWEMYPSAGELFSVALFAKQFTNPIERVYGSGSGGTSFVFFTNAKSASNYGVELEVRKELGDFTRALNPFAVFSNVTVMNSTIRLYDSTQSSATNLSRRMVGQAPYVVNAGLSYTSSGGGSIGTLLFNRVGERITAAGSIPLPDVIEQSRNVLDFSFRRTMTQLITLRADFKNLLDSPYKVVQGTVTRESYHMGRTVNVGFQVRP